MSLAHVVVRRRGWFLAGWLVAAAVAVPLAPRVSTEFDVAARVHGSEAGAVQQAIQSRFATPFATFALLVVSGIPAPASARGATELQRIIAALDSIPAVAGTFSYQDIADSLFVGAGGRGTYIVVGLDNARGDPDDQIPNLRAATASVQRALQARYPGAALRWTGDAPINYDMRAVSAAESRAAELRVLPLTLLLLLLAFGAVVAAVLPLISAGLSIVVVLAGAVLINEVFPLSILLQNVVSMIGLGVGIDYALLTVSRFREARVNGMSAEDAAAEAASLAGRTIFLSGATVIIGFAALILVPLNELQSVGIGGIMVVSVAMLSATTLLPGLLSWLGNRVDWGRFRTGAARLPILRVNWEKWGRTVVAHPHATLVLAGVPVLVLALQALQLRAEFPRGAWLPRQSESAQALEDLAAMQRSGPVNSLRVLVDYPDAINVYEQRGWTATRRLVDEIERDRRVARVQTVVTLVPSLRPDVRLLSAVPVETLRSFVSRDRHSVLVEVIPREGLSANELMILAADLRRLEAMADAMIAGSRLRVGGMGAFNADYDLALKRWFPIVIALVVGVTFAALVIGFRSVLIPIKALVLNLLSVAGAFGALVVVFQNGIGVGLTGLSEPLGAVFPVVPILVFCIVFGLSMDYEIFLVARVREARRAGASEDEAIVEGLARTGGVITSAAAIMCVVFAAFMLGSFVFVKVLGLALAAAVFIDATVMRMAVGPALLKLAGRWNWWPGERIPNYQQPTSDNYRLSVGGGRGQQNVRVVRHG